MRLLREPFVKRFTLCYRTYNVFSGTLDPTHYHYCYRTVVLSVTLVHCGQTVGWIKMKLDMEVDLAHTYCDQIAGWIPLGMKVGLGPGDFVLDADPAPLFKKGAQPLNFPPKSIVAKLLDGSRWQLAWRWASVHATLC